MSVKKLEYNLKINEFEGPLDVLLFLVCKNKMNIFDINLSILTDEYILYLESMSDFNMNMASEFIVMASTLLNIKSKKVLPEIEEKVDEDEITEEQMIARIIEYKKYKEIANIINNMYISNFGTFVKPLEKIKFEINNEYLGDKFNKSDIYNVYVSIITKNLNKINKNFNYVEKLALHEKITVKHKANEILKILEKSNNIKFNEIFNNLNSSNLEIVTAFLSTLELSKLNKICVMQESAFTDINIIKSM